MARVLTGVAHASARGGLGRAAILGLVFWLCFNSNGREIPTVDSQGAKLAAVMLLRHHALTLDGVVGREPLYAERLAFQRDREGHWRNAYPLPPVLEAAAVGSALRRAGTLDLGAPLAPGIVAKLTASLLASIASVLAFLIARRFCGPLAASAVAIGFGLGTGIWPVASQTLWQHASVIWSEMAVLWLWTRPGGMGGNARHLLAGALLGWAISARPQTAPLMGILAAAVFLRASWRERIACLAGICIPVIAFATLNVQWFGHPGGTMEQFERASLEAHRVRSTWQWPWRGAAGLLVSPSRGLLVFSPIVLVVLAARPRPQERPILWWTLAAAAAQFLVYASFSVWWGGHTYGPRYVLDLLPALVPAAAMGAARLARAHVSLRVVAAAALAWSVAVAATGAFCYPHDEWNNDPASVDQFHERLWDVRDSQILRCWNRGLSPQNFAFFDRAVWRRPSLADTPR
jgi:hypothetical protein